MRTFEQIIFDKVLTPYYFARPLDKEDLAKLNKESAIQYAKEALDAQLDYLINAGYIKEEDIAKTKSGYFQYLKDTLK